LLGKYRIDRVLGRGGMGVVVEAHHLALDERVALKFLLPQLAVLPDATERFLREARAVIRIKGEHVARVMDVGTLQTGEPFLVMEFLEGEDLLKVLKRAGQLPIFEAVDYVIQACDAIAEAHALGIVHRDIKLANLFRTVGPDGSVIVKVLDFGISKVSGSKGIDRLTRTAMTMGSAHYMSPEQMHSMRDVDHRADIYSLGVTLFTLLAGQHPFPGDSVPAVYANILTGTPVDLGRLRPDVPEPLARAIARAYAREPAGRYPSVAELVFAISAYAPPQSKPTIDRVARMTGRAAPPSVPLPHPPFGDLPAPPPSPPALAGDMNTEAATQILPPRRAPSKAPLVVAVLGCVVTMLALAGGLLWMRSRTTPAPAETSEATPPPPPPEATSTPEQPAPTAEPSLATTAEAPATATAASSAPAAPIVRRPAPPVGGRLPIARPSASAAPTAAPTAAPAASKPSAFDMR